MNAQTMPNKILIITYSFPPSNHAAVHRILRFCKWLPRYGWEPIILTVKDGHYDRYDTELNKFVPDDLKVYKASSFELNDRFWGKIQKRGMIRIAIPDRQITWVPDAVLKGKQLINKHGINIVFTTLGPYSTALIGYFLKRITGVKWVMDYRDPWCLNPLKSLSPLRYALEKRLEDLMLHYSDYNLTTSDLMTNLFRENYPEIANRFCTITNCYDEELQYVNEVESINQSNRKFRIVHTGSFYTRREPTNFLKALIELMKKYPNLQDKIEVLLVGGISRSIKEEILNINGIRLIDFRFIGTIPYQESMQYICSADLLLAINGTEKRDNIFIPAKTFDYIAARRPILFIGHKGSASEIIECGNLGAAREHEDIDGIGKDILQIYNKWKDSQPFEPNTQYLSMYYAGNVVRRLASVLNHLNAYGDRSNQLAKC